MEINSMSVKEETKETCDVNKITVEKNRGNDERPY